MELVLPRNHVELHDEEMMYLEGGAIPAIPTVIGWLVGAIGAGYGGGYAIGKRVAYSSSKKKVKAWYKNAKWPIRAGVLSIAGVFGKIVFLGFENGLYDTLAKR